MARIELVDDNQPKSERSSSTKLKLLVNLPSVEEQLKVLSAAFKELETPGLEQSKVLRLRSIINGVKI